MGGTAAFIDAEQALDPVYAANLGINLDELYISQPDSGEQALDILDYLVRSNAVDLIVVDSGCGSYPAFGTRRRYGRKPYGRTGSFDVAMFA